LTSLPRPAGSALETGLVDRQNRFWLSGRFDAVGFGAGLENMLSVRGTEGSNPSPSSGELTPENNDQKVGIDIVKRALHSPVRQVAENAGNDGSIVVGKLLDANDLNRGFDAQSGEYVDMVKSGIIDPTKVVRLALQNAASVAGLLVTTEAMVAEKPKKETSPAISPGGGMDGMEDY
jgi:chaperonin GroEL